MQPLELFILLLNSYGGLIGILGTAVIYVVLLLLILWVKPLHRWFKIHADLEAAIWFACLFFFTLYKLISL